MLDINFTEMQWLNCSKKKQVIIFSTIFRKNMLDINFTEMQWLNCNKEKKSSFSVHSFKEYYVRHPLHRDVMVVKTPVLGR